MKTSLILRTAALSVGTMLWTVQIAAQRLPKAIAAADNFHETVKHAEAYFAENERGSAYKHYMRWKGAMQYRIQPDGTMPNATYHNMQALKEARRHNAQKTRASNGDWTNIGPFDYTGNDVFFGGGLGRLNCLEFHPTNNDIMWVGAPNGGLWKTADGGATWVPLTDMIGPTGVQDIFVDHINPSIIYILTGDGEGLLAANQRPIVPSIGVLKSTDGGMSWQSTGLSFTADQTVAGYVLKGHPTNPDILYVGLAGLGIQRSLDGGDNWSLVTPGLTVWDIEFHPTNPFIMYAATSQGLYKSTTLGASWVPLTDPTLPTSGFPRIELAVGESAPDALFALYGGAGPTGDGSFQGLFKSSNAGSSWSLMSTTPNILASDLSGGGPPFQPDYMLALDVNPNDSTQIFAGSVNGWKSDDSGVTWSRETWKTRNYHPIDPYVHADWHDIQYRGSTIFCVNDGGIYKSADFGNSWTELSAGLATGMIYEMDLHNSNYLIGLQDNGVNTAALTNPQSHNLLGGDGFACIWAANDAVQFIASQDRLGRREAGSNIYIWEELNGFWYSKLARHPTNGNYIILSKGDILYRANQGWAIWDYNFDDLGTSSLLNGWIMGFSQCPTNTNVMYVADINTILKSTNFDLADPTWALLSNPAAGQALLTDVLVNPDNAQQAWITCGGYTDSVKVFVTTNGGSSWQNISSGIPNTPVRCISYAPGSNQQIFIGTDIGVFYRDASMSDWQYYSTYLPATIVAEIGFMNGEVIAATHGRGLWKSSMPSCPTNLSLTVANDPNAPNATGQEVHQASSTITSTRNVWGAYSDVEYNAGSYVSLQPGFRARPGSTFQALAQGCQD